MSESKDYSRSPATGSVSVPMECAGLRLDQALAQIFPQHSRSRLQGWLKAGHIVLDGAPQAEAKRKVWGGEQLSVVEPPLPEDTAQQAEDIALDIVFEDEALIVLNKPAGLVVHPGSGNWSGTLLNALLHHAPALAGLPRAGIVHRLDKDTSGLMVVARTLEAQTSLVRQLQARSVQRHYVALVHGTPPAQGTADAPLGRHPVQRTRMAVVANGRAAVTHYRVIERLGELSLVECRLETGRTHQIRVHMTHLGHPLVGDPVYGRRTPRDPLLAAFPRQALHAFELGLQHPLSGTECSWRVPYAADLTDLLAALRARQEEVK